MSGLTVSELTLARLTESAMVRVKPVPWMSTTLGWVRASALPVKPSRKPMSVAKCSASSTAVSAAMAAPGSNGTRTSQLCCAASLSRIAVYAASGSGEGRNPRATVRPCRWSAVSDSRAVTSSSSAARKPVAWPRGLSAFHRSQTC